MSSLGGDHAFDDLDVDGLEGHVEAHLLDLFFVEGAVFVEYLDEFPDLGVNEINVLVAHAVVVEGVEGKLSHTGGAEAHIVGVAGGLDELGLDIVDELADIIGGCLNNVP